nr:uncharacterized protein LOC116154294 [Camelus dromedarius]
MNEILDDVIQDIHTELQSKRDQNRRRGNASATRATGKRSGCSGAQTPVAERRGPPPPPPAAPPPAAAAAAAAFQPTRRFRAREGPRFPHALPAPLDNRAPGASEEPGWSEAGEEAQTPS